MRAIDACGVEQACSHQRRFYTAACADYLGSPSFPQPVLPEAYRGTHVFRAPSIQLPATAGAGSCKGCAGPSSVLNTAGEDGSTGCRGEDAGSPMPVFAGIMAALDPDLPHNESKQ